MTELWITGTGAISAVGLTAVQTSAAVRAGITRFTDHPYHFPLMDPEHPVEPEPLTCSAVPTVDALHPRRERMLDLLLATLQELFSQSRIARADLADAALFVAVAPEVAGVEEWGVEQALIPELVRRAALHPPRIAGVGRQGGTAFFHLLSEAAQRLASGECRFAIVGGVDSMLDEEMVRHLDASWRLKSARNADGFVPGEGAALVMLELPSTAEARGARPLGRLSMPHFANEDRPATGELNSTGAGLTRALREAMQASGVAPAWVIADLNGESYRSYEWGLALARMGGELSGLRALWHPADCLGEIGCAATAMHVVLACQAFDRARAPDPSCLIFASDQGGERGACVLRGPA